MHLFRRKGARAVAAVTIVLPILLVGWTCVTGPIIPHNDYWMYLRNIVGDDGASPSLAGWTTLHNNHVLTGAYAVYAANLLLTRGSNHGLTVFSWLCAIAVLGILVVWTRRARSGGDEATRWFVAAQSWALFSPFLAMFWVVGFSGVHTLGSVLLSLVAIELWLQFRISATGSRLVGCGLVVALSLTFFSSSLALVPVLGLASLTELRRRDRRMLPFLAVLGLMGVLYLWSASTSPQFPAPPPVAGIASLLLFPFVVLGSPFTRLVEPALAAGLLVTGALVWMAIRHLRHGRGELSHQRLAWWMLAGYGGVNALMMAATRSGDGLGAAFATRYSVFPVLFWIAVAVLIAAELPGAAGRWAGFSLLCATALACHLNGASYLRALEYRADLEPAARIALDAGVHDKQAIRGSITPWIFSFTRMIPALKAHGWVPFHHAERADRRIEAAGESPPDSKLKILGWLDLGASRYRLVGAAPGSLPVGARLRIVDPSSGVIVGRAVVTPGIRRRSDPDARWWIGYLRVEDERRLVVVDEAGRTLGATRCCAADRPLAPALNPYQSPYPHWSAAGEFLSRSLQRRLEPNRTTPPERDDPA